MTLLEKINNVMAHDHDWMSHVAWVECDGGQVPLTRFLAFANTYLIYKLYCAGIKSGLKVVFQDNSFIDIKNNKHNYTVVEYHPSLKAPPYCHKQDFVFLS